MQTHVKVVAWLYIALSAVDLLVAVCVWLFFVGMGVAAHDAGAFAPLTVIGTVGAILLTVLGLPGLMVGWGMLNRASWARIGLIVMSVLNIVHVPLGTALGLYGLYVAFSDEGAAMLNGRTAW